MQGILWPALALAVFIFGVYPVASLILAAKILKLATVRQLRQSGLKYGGLLFLMSSFAALAFAVLYAMVSGASA